jgi:hypothetical protein
MGEKSGRGLRFGVFVMTVGLAVLAGAPAAFAAAPSNDTFSGATSISSLPFTDTVDTTEATTDADDAQANATCGAPATDASVWYSLAGNGEFVTVDVSASDYSAGALVATGTQGNLATVACGPGSTAFLAESGTTYYILVFDDQQNGDGLNGGSMSLSVTSAPAPSVDALTVNSVAKFHKDGSATVSGTMTCSGGVNFTEIDISLSQTVGRTRISGFGFAGDITCDGTAQAWSADVSADNGLFRGGKAAASVDAVACNDFTCSDISLQKTINIKK